MVLNFIAEPQTLKAIAIREALDLSDDLYERRIHVASDCKLVVQNLKKRKKKQWIEWVEFVLLVKHVPRESHCFPRPS